MGKVHIWFSQSMQYRLADVVYLANYRKWWAKFDNRNIKFHKGLMPK